MLLKSDADARTLRNVIGSLMTNYRVALGRLLRHKTACNFKRQKH